MTRESPRVTKAITDHLSKAFPNKLPEYPTTAQEVARLQGQQEVINHLRSLQNRG